MLRLVLAVFAVLSAGYPCFALPAGWNIRESSHFIIYYRSADINFIEDLTKRSEAYYKSIPEKLGLNSNPEWKGSSRSKIYIYDTSKQYQAATGEPEWSDGSSIQRLRVIFSFSKASRFLDSIFPHELAHIIFREAVGFENDSVPIWLEEGVASFQENPDLARIEQSLRFALNKGLLPGLDRLQGINPRYLKDKDQIDLFYGQALSVVNFIISRNGPERFGFFCRLLGEEKNLDRPLTRAFGYKSIQDLDESWRRYLKE